MNIFVYGWYGHGNIGDESYKLSFVQTWPEHSFTFSDKFTEAEYDLIIVGGGDVIRPALLTTISKFKCPKIAISVTVTEQSLSNEIKVFDYIFVRDSKSLKVLNDFGFTNCTYLPDISIALRGDDHAGWHKLNCYDFGIRDNIFTVIVNAHLMDTSQSKYYDAITFRKFVADLSVIADRTDASFIFLPFSTKQPWDDRVSNGIANSECKKFSKNLVIYDEVSVKDAVNIIAGSNKIITSRFHGLIFGLGNNIPTTTLSFHDKFSGFCETVGQPYLNYYDMSLSSLENSILNSKVNPINFDNIKQEYIEKVHFLR